jgi:hypothetical protein
MVEILTRKARVVQIMARINDVLSSDLVHLSKKHSEPMEKKIMAESGITVLPKYSSIGDMIKKIALNMATLLP